MKKLLFIALILFAGKAMASSLPNCPSDQSERYNNCFGTFTTDDGSIYKGEIQNFLREGEGTYIYGKNTKWAGHKYVGEFKNNKRNGQGTYTYPNGDKYVGEHKDGKSHGQGTFTWFDGSKFVGKFNDGDQQQGTFTTEIDGIESEYVGEFKNNIMHGQGTIKFNNITFRKGYFMNGDHVSDLCEDMGLIKGSDPFGQCVVELIKQIRDDD